MGDFRPGKKEVHNFLLHLIFDASEKRVNKIDNAPCRLENSKDLTVVTCYKLLHMSFVTSYYTCHMLQITTFVTCFNLSHL